MARWKFHCDSSTKGECLQKRLFGGASNVSDSITEGDELLLHDLDADIIYGPFISQTDEPRTIDPNAWSDHQYDFSKQVRVDWNENDLYRLPAKEFDNVKYTMETQYDVGTENGNKIVSQLRGKGEPININPDGKIVDAPGNKPDFDWNPSFWQITPGGSAKKWDAFRDEGVASIGHDLGIHRGRNRPEAIEEAQSAGENNRKNTRFQAYQFQECITEGDVIIAKHTNPERVFAIGTVSEAYNPLSPQKIDDEIHYDHQISVDWLVIDNDGMELWADDLNIVSHAFDQLSEDEFRTIVKIIDSEDYVSEREIYNHLLDSDWSNNTRVAVSTIGDPNLFDRPAIAKEAMTHLISGKNILLYGPPGSGKTRLATQLLEIYCSTEQIETAHAEWTQYDVVGGPTLTSDGGFKPHKGYLTEAALACRDSLQSKGEPSWLLIDELNRANLDEAFGDVFTLLDLDYRSEENKLSVGNETTDDLGITVSVPLAFRLLATMNTTDQAQLFALGYAFRRRFAIIEVPSLLVNDAESSAVTPPSLDRDNLAEPVPDQREMLADALDNRFEHNNYPDWDSPLGLPALEDSVSHRPDLANVRATESLTAGELDVDEVLLYLGRRACQLDLVEVGQGLVIDALSYIQTHKMLFPDSTTWEVVDTAVKAYLLPQFDALLPDIRKAAVAGDTSNVDDRLKKFEDDLESLHLPASRGKVTALREDQEPII